MLQWTKAKVGCYWNSGNYTIGTVSGGGLPPSYYLFFDKNQIGVFPTLEAAQQEAERHAKEAK